MMTKSFLCSIAVAFCLWACGDKENNVLTPEPVDPVQVEPTPIKPVEPVEPEEPETRHSYKPVQLNEKEQAINAKLHEFSWKLFKEVYRGRKAGENLMISPISLEVDLGMFLNGLEGNSYQELLKTLGLQDYTKQELNSFFQTMMTGIENADEAAIFKGANAFWYNQNRKANQTFLNAITSYYAARAEAMDFSKPQTKNIINAWCAEQTNDRIKGMVDSTDESDLFHLMNAVYFKADWDDKQLTSKMPFQYANGKSEEVDMMYDVYEGTYAETEQYQLGVRPFVDGSFQMVFILPKKGVAMEDVIPAVLDYKVTITAEWYPGKPQQATIELYAPKFTSEYTEEHLFDYMKVINPNLKFDWHELSLMEEKEPLDLSALQKTFFLMDEEGAEAAAVTDIIAKNTSVSPIRVAQLYLDRPFIYAIVETKTSCPLFIGYYGK